MSKIRNRIFTKFERADKELVDAFRGIPSSNTNDEMNRLFCMNESMRLINPKPGKSMVGTAFTVKAPIGDNLYLHYALDMAQPGDIIVVDGGGYANRSFCGEIMMRFAQKKGLAGVVIDGCIRDSDGMKNLDMPVYAVGVTPQGPFKNGPGEINTPVSCAGQVVFPGDILVGDEDGITVVHKQDAAEVLAAAQKKKAGEDKTFELMESDLAAYAKKHEASTEQRAEGKGIVFVDEVYTKAYDL